jgi:oligopeptide transport system ATP-binding protein
MSTLLDVRNLTTLFKTENGIVQAVNGISFQICRGETIGLVGESGCGKSVTMRTILRLIRQPPGIVRGGPILFDGQHDLLNVTEEQMRRIRGREIAMIFQDPMSSLNPVLTVGRQLTEVLEEHMRMNRWEAYRRAVQLLEMVGIPNAKQRLNEYPHQFSGGMRQRAMIAMALACSPKLLIADEPTTALDVTIQAQIIDLVKELQHEFEMAVIWITHDLGVVARLAQRVLVMYSGYIVEDASVNELFYQPLHPYTAGLLASLPRLDEQNNASLSAIPGQPPNQAELPRGCPFTPRCTLSTQRCAEENPALEQYGRNHWAACWESEKLVFKAKAKGQ